MSAEMVRHHAARHRDIQAEDEELLAELQAREAARRVPAVDQIQRKFALNLKHGGEGRIDEAVVRVGEAVSGADVEGEAAGSCASRIACSEALTRRIACAAASDAACPAALVVTVTFGTGLAAPLAGLVGLRASATDKPVNNAATLAPVRNIACLTDRDERRWTVRWDKTAFLLAAWPRPGKGARPRHPER